MKHEVRRQDREISKSESIGIILNGEFGVLSICTLDKEGYGIPMNYVYHDNAIYFHCALEGSKIEYLRANNKVSFCVVGKTEMLPSKFGTMYESAIVFGVVTEIDGIEKRNALFYLIEKYSADYVAQGEDYINRLYDRVKILKLSIDAVTGKARKE
jgi:uncharacterized protein